MMLTIGAKLGPYEILGAIGAGGMGEVYRARDTRLGRDVAIKILPQHLTEKAVRQHGSLNRGTMLIVNERRAIRKQSLNVRMADRSPLNCTDRSAVGSPGVSC